MFQNRQEAGRLLAQRLQTYKSEDPVVLALPRGGVPVGYEIAAALGAPLDVVIARKLGAPFMPELAIGAIVGGDEPVKVLNEDIISAYGVSDEDIEAQVNQERNEIKRREDMYRAGRDPVPLEGTTAILVDDGIATGASVRAAIRGVRRRSPDRLILAVPVAPPSTVRSLRPEVDELICLDTPEPFEAVGSHYADFYQVPDEEVIALLDSARQRAH